MAITLAGGNIVTTDQVRAERCLAEIKKILAAHNCQILPQVLIVGSQIVQSGYVVVAATAIPPDLQGNKGNGQ
jgi:hypothetical protein